MHDDVDTSYQIQDSPLLRQMLYTRIPKFYMKTKMSLNNHDNLADPTEHVRNVRNNLEFVINDNDANHQYRHGIIIWSKTPFQALVTFLSSWLHDSAQLSQL